MNSLIVLSLILISGAKHSFSSHQTFIAHSELLEEVKPNNTLISSDNPSVIAVKQLKSILDTNYDKNFPPNLGEKQSIGVNVTIYIIKYKFDHDDKETYIDLYFRQKWFDKRLNISETGVPVQSGQYLVDKVWTPDTFFSTTSSVKSSKYPAPNVFIRINQNGNIIYSQRLQLINYCNQNGTDSYVCTLDIESYGYSQKDIEYNWGNGLEDKVVTINSNLDVNKYKLVKFEHVKNIEVLSTGNYSILKLNLHFVKQNRVKSESKEDD